jgi:hypothetical protein
MDKESSRRTDYPHGPPGGPGERSTRITQAMGSPCAQRPASKRGRSTAAARVRWGLQAGLACTQFVQSFEERDNSGGRI